jgi:hypothetical protein
MMKYPGDGTVVIPSLKRNNITGSGDFDIKSIRVLGYEAKVSFSRSTDALRLEVKGAIDTEYPVGFAILLD